MINKNNRKIAPTYFTRDGDVRTTSDTPRLWVQDDEPDTAIPKDVWIDTNDYSRYDVLEVIVDTIVTADDPEVIQAFYNVTITLDLGSTAGVVKIIGNYGTGVITVTGAVDMMGAPTYNTFYLFPGEVVHLTTVEGVS